MLKHFFGYYLFDYEIKVYPKYSTLNDDMLKEKMDHFSQVLMKDDDRILEIIACFYDENGEKVYKCKSTSSKEVTSFDTDPLIKKYSNGEWKILVMPYYLFEHQKVNSLKKQMDKENMDLFKAYEKYKKLPEFIWRNPLPEPAVNISDAVIKLEEASKCFKKEMGHKEAYQKLYCLIIFNKNESITDWALYADPFALTIKEWGLDILHNEIIKHGTKAAVAAIMGRNMSHNIGSHVLSYWKNDLDAGNKLLCEYISGTADLSKRNFIENLFDSTKVKNKESGNYIEKSYFLFDYLKNRMDFIAEITTTPPSWEKSINLHAIFQRFFEQKALLDSIILSESFCYIGSSVSMCKQCYKKNAGGKCDACEDKREMELVPYKIILKNKDSLKEIDVSVPHGYIGEQAIYSIFENLIRNSAKHGGKKIKERILKKADAAKTFEINIKAEDDGEFITLTVSDNVGNCNDTIKDSNGKKKRIIEFLNDGLQDAGDSGYVSSIGELIKEKWGIKEIKMSANFLRKRTTDSLIDKSQIDDDDKGKPLIHLACYESNCKTRSTCSKNIAYTFYLRKPKEACIVYSDKELNSQIIEKKIDLQKKGILILTLSEAIDILKKKENIPHRFLVLSSENTWENLKKNRTFDRQRLPLRIIVNGSGNKSSKAADNKKLLKEVYSSVDFDKLMNSVDDFIEAIYKSYCTKFKVQNITTQMPSNGEKNKSIYFDDHGKNYEKSKIEGIFYYHPYGTTIGKTFYDYFEPHKSNLEPIKSELIEMANVKVVIADERIYNINQNKKVSAQVDNKLKLLKNYMKVSVVPVISGVINENNVRKDNNAGDFLIIHQGLIDKMTDKKGFYKAVKEKYSYIVIDSGRGVPSNLEKGTSYIEIGALERFVDELDKYSLIQTLFSLRRPKHV